MEITKTCPFCGVAHTLDIDVEPEQMEMWDNEMLIQEAMPHLTPDEREFIKTGICECWPSDPDEEQELDDAEYKSVSAKIWDKLREAAKE